MELQTRSMQRSDAYALLNLYLEIAARPGTFARAVSELSPEYINETMDRVLDGGAGMVALHPEEPKSLIGFIWARKLGPKVFDHILSDLTIGVHPDYQRKGVGRRLFLDFLEHVTDQRPDILRVELVVRESNQHAIGFYESLGFRREGVFEFRIRNENGSFEADIPMAWVKAQL